MGRAIRGVHGHQPARGEPMGTWPTGRFRDDLQPRRRARSRNPTTITRSPTRRSAIRFFGTLRGRTVRNGTAACKMASTSRRSDAIPARCSGSSPISPRIALLPPTSLAPAIIDFKNNSVNFAGLQTLEEKIAALRPRHGREKFLDLTRDWPRRASRCSTPIAAVVTRCRLRSICRAFGARRSSRWARTRRCSRIRSAPPGPGSCWAR